MKVLVTGGSGFIGAHVVEVFLKHGHDVVNMDLVGNGPAGVTTYVRLSDALRTDPDVIVHMAAVADVGEVVKNPAYATEVNVGLTAQLLEEAVKRDVRRFVFISTTWVYQACASEWVDESTPIVMPAHFYSVTKLAGESLCSLYSDRLETVILRYGIPYGPGARDNLVVPLFVGKAMRGEALTISGDGKQFRQFIDVRDLAEGTRLAASGPHAPVICLDGERPVTINDLVSAVQSHFPGVAAEYTPARAGDFRGKVVSTLLASKLLKWQPKVAFEDGLADYIGWRIARDEARSRAAR